MARLTKEMKQYLLAAKKNAEYQLRGLPDGSYWQGYYQGKLDQIDFALRFGTGKWHWSFGGLIEEHRLKRESKKRIRQGVKRLMQKFQAK